MFSPVFSERDRHIESQIFAKEAEIEQLQRELQQLQALRQALGSVEGAAQSALEQVAKAIAMIRNVAPDQLELFMERVNELAAQPDAIASLPEAPDPEPTEEGDSAPGPNPDGTDEVLEVEAGAELPDVPASQESVPALFEDDPEKPQPLGDGEAPGERAEQPKPFASVGAAAKNYREMGIRELKREASLAGVKGYSSMRKEQLIAALEAKAQATS